MITRNIHYFTQDQINYTPSEYLSKDRIGGGNNPYVIGTILVNDDGTPLYGFYSIGNAGQRVCIEHSQDAFLDYKVYSKGSYDAITFALTQLNEDCPFGEIIRVGIIPLGNSTVTGSPISTAKLISHPNAPEFQKHFNLVSDAHVSLSTEDRLYTEPVAYEVSDLFSATPFYTNAVYFQSCEFVSDVVLYVVYARHGQNFTGNHRHAGGSQQALHDTFFVNGNMKAVVIERSAVTTNSNLRISMNNGGGEIAVLYDGEVFPDEDDLPSYVDVRRAPFFLDTASLTPTLGDAIPMYYGTQIQCEVGDLNSKLSPVKLEIEPFEIVDNA